VFGCVFARAIATTSFSRVYRVRRPQLHARGLRNARDLSPDQKAAIESLLGRRVLEDEEISIRAIHPPGLSDQRRKELVEELTKCFADVDGRRKPGPAEEAEEILTEAIRSTRPGYRPHQ
jgi:hypothetical protein